MEIAMVYDAVFPWEKGGAQKRVWELARRLVDDHEVHLYGMHYWDGPPTIEREGVVLHGVSPPYDLYAGERRAIPPAIKFATRLAPHLLREEYDVVDCQQFPYFPVLVSKLHELLTETTLVVTWYELWADYWYEYLGRKGWFGKTIETMTYRLPDHIVPISEAIADDLRAAGRTDGMTVVKNGVDYSQIQEIDPLDETWDFVYIGRLAEHKNVDLLLDAVSTASERIGRSVQTCIIGDGPERDRLEEHSRGVGVTDHVTFKGFVEADEDVLGTLKTASAFALPSEREGFPNTILEANACGVPSIIVEAPENGATAVVDHRETGLITDPDPGAFADAIVEMLADDELRDHLSAGARRYGREHDWSRIVSELEQVYLNAVSEGE